MQPQKLIECLGVRKKQLVATSVLPPRVLVVPRGTASACHVLVGWASSKSHLIDGLEVRPTGITGWERVPSPASTLRSLLVIGTKLFRTDMLYRFALKEVTCLWYGAHLRVRPGNGQTRGSAPTDAGILQLEIEFVSSVRKRIGITWKLFGQAVEWDL